MKTIAFHRKFVFLKLQLAYNKIYGKYLPKNGGVENLLRSLKTLGNVFQK